ncbi:MAG: Holliday junction branch migration protein RuvA [Solirubrobacterales bacterium]
MIASVRGEVLVRRPDHVVVESGGVGYRLSVSAETLKAVPARGKEATLHAQLVARDDSLVLYGFASEEERDLFRELTSVSGIGPKVAIAILSGGTPRELLRAIAAGDAKRFQAVPGIGKRTAERVIVELREKVAGELEEGLAAAADGDGEGAPRLLARDGLMHLGYTLSEADKLLDGAEGESPEELIGSALRAAGAREGV